MVGSGDSSVALLASIVLCLVSIGCLVGGIVYLKMATKQEREHLTVPYEDAVRSWPAIRKDFDGLTVTARAVTTSVSLEANLTADVLKDEENILPTYEPLVYRSSGTPKDFFPSAELGAMKALPMASPLGKRTAHGPDMHLEINLAGSILKLQPYPSMRATVRRSPGIDEQIHCSPRQGVDIAGECWAFSKLERMCVQVERDNTSAWRLAPRVPGRIHSYGCDYAGGDWTTPVYGQMRMEGRGIHSAETWPTGIVRFENLVIEVRSRWDPYLLAQELTLGKLSFGMTAEEEDVLGIVLIVMSVGFSCPLFCTLCRYWCRSRSKRTPRRYRPSSSQRWRHSRDPDPEMVGMRYAMDEIDSSDNQIVEHRSACPTGLELAIDDAIEKGNAKSRPAQILE